MNGEPGGEASVGAAPSRHLTTVERVIAAMHRHEDGTLYLHTMAEMANLSPYHFARMFRNVTGIPPGEFLTAVGLERAQRLLLGTEMGVAEVCFEVGYESVGTFATRFKDLVGLPPGRMRRLPEELHAALCRVGGWYQPLLSSLEEAGVAFRVHGPDLGGSVIFVGLFPTAVPQRGRSPGRFWELREATVCIRYPTDTITSWPPRCRARRIPGDSSRRATLYAWVVPVIRWRSGEAGPASRWT